MKFLKNYLAFFLIVLALSSLFNCKGKNKSAIKVANEFVEAGMNGEYEKLAGLCCKYDGPYTTLEDVKYLDLGGFGFIKKILREEKYEIDPSNTKIVVARLDIEGRVGFRCFYMFKTPKSYKVYLDADWLREYPPNKESLFNTALNFYFANKINLKNATKFAEHIIATNPNYVKAHYILASIYILNNQKPNAITEIKKIIDIDPNSRYILSFDKNYLIATAEDFFKGEGTKSRIQAIKLLNKIPPDDRKIPFIEKALQDESSDVKVQALTLVDKLPDDRKILFIEKALQDESSDVKVQALTLVDKLPDDRKIPLFKKTVKDKNPNVRMKTVVFFSNVVDKRKIPLLEEALQDEVISIKEKAARILSSLGSTKGKSALASILSDKLRKSIFNSWKVKRYNEWPDVKIIGELSNYKDAKVAEVLIDYWLLSREAPHNQIIDALLIIGKPAIPAIEAALARENEYMKKWVELGGNTYFLKKKFSNPKSWDIGTVLRKLKERK